jgi:segregation and condensation protein A
MAVRAAASAADGAGEGDTPHLELTGFSGPLSLLLSEARAGTTDLARLSLTACMRQVTQALNQADPTISLARRADWLVMAAWLVLLWSRLLLPAAAVAEDAGEEDPDRRPDHVHALLAAQALAAWLERRPQLGIDVFPRGQPEVIGTEIGTTHQVDVIEFLWACLAQFQDDGDSIDSTTPYRPARLALWTVPDARERILQLLAAFSDDAPLDQFLPRFDTQAEATPATPLPLRRRSAVASTLIAGLELAREGRVTLHQAAPFAPITLCAHTGLTSDQVGDAMA